MILMAVILEGNKVHTAGLSVWYNCDTRSV